MYVDYSGELCAQIAVGANSALSGGDMDQIMIDSLVSMGISGVGNLGKLLPDIISRVLTFLGDRIWNALSP